MPCIVNSLGSQNDKFCLALRIGKEIRKICLFGFSKGGIFISFPYCLDSRGQLGKMTLPGGKKKFDKAPSPSPIRFTKHTVKSHHHADGHSFFSETGKIFSTHWFGINTHSFPIKDFNGHFATIMLQGTDAFELGDEKPISAKKYHPIAGCFSDRKDDAYKIVFWCYSSEDEVKRVLKEYEKYAEVPAHHTVKYDNGRIFEELFIRDNAEQLFLIITIEQMPRFEDKNYPTQMSFIGGFDTNIKDIESDAVFLMLAYPIRENFDELVRRFGSADYQPGQKISLLNS